jgi:hypothetical protein
MSDDWNNCVMVIILFIIVFIYYSYLKTLLELKREWRNFKCNPIYMLMSSLIKPKKEENSSNFQRCVSEVFAKEYSQTDVNTIVAQQLLSSQNITT